MQCILCTWQLLTKIRKYYIFKMSEFPSFDHAVDEKSSILFCLPLNISRLINLQLKVSVSIFHTEEGIIQGGIEL